MFKLAAKKIEVKNNWWNIVTAVLIFVGMLILIGLSAVYAYKNDAEYIMGPLSAILLFGSLIALTFLIEVLSPEKRQ